MNNALDHLRAYDEDSAPDALKAHEPWPCVGVGGPVEELAEVVPVEHQSI